MGFVAGTFCHAVSTDELKSYIGVFFTFPESSIHGGFLVVLFLLSFSYCPVIVQCL